MILRAFLLSALLVPLHAQSINISPANATVAAGGQVQFTFAVAGISSTSVSLASLRWLIAGVGTIDQNGLYTAPPTVAGPSFAQVELAGNLQGPGQTSPAARFGFASVLVTPAASAGVGPPGKSPTVSAEHPGPNCLKGGIKITDAAGNTAFACSGNDGIGTPGAGVTVSQEPPGSHCPTGGAKFVDAAGNTAYACSAPATSPTAGLCDDPGAGVIACSEGPTPCTTYVCTCVDGEIVSCP